MKSVPFKEILVSAAGFLVGLLLWYAISKASPKLTMEVNSAFR